MGIFRRLLGIGTVLHHYRDYWIKHDPELKRLYKELTSDIARERLENPGINLCDRCGQEYSEAGYKCWMCGERFNRDC